MMSFFPRISLNFWLFVVIVLEGYVVLSSELLAIRQSIPYVGSGTDTVSIIIAAVLMPLAFGYYAAGRFKPRAGYGIRDKLITNILIAMVILLPGLSYIALGEMYEVVVGAGIKNRLIHVALYSAIFLVTPVYLLGQTIPLVSNYFGKDKLARVTGRILFFSTWGSFCGAIVSTLVLMAWIGVNNTAALNFSIMAFLVLVLAKKPEHDRRFYGAVIIAVLALVLNSDWAEHRHGGVLEHNLYNSIAVKVGAGERHLFLNNSASSKYSDEGRKYPYVEDAEMFALHHLYSENDKKDILVMGAGAFTFGYEDEFHHYDFVDIDKSLKGVAEAHILPKPLTANKTFHPVPARAFLSHTNKRYDVIFVDTYFGKLSLPEHLVTVEFFEQVKAHLKDDAVLITNFAVGPNFVDAFSRNLDNTMRRVFPYISRHVVGGKYQPWNDDPRVLSNVLYVYRHGIDFGEPSIYTDNQNRVFYDRP